MRFTDKPKTRSNLRMFLGRSFFTLKRYFDWFLSGKNFASEKVLNKNLENLVYRDNSPLRRPFKQVEEYLTDNKIVNLKIAINSLNGLIIKPGETFSYWKLIGRPSSAKGYLPGFVLHNGKIATEVGGGLCQLSNLIYWITLHTNLDVIERWRHNYDVFPDMTRNRPFGSGATCSYNYVDLQIKNNTNHSFQLLLELTDNDLFATWYSNVSPLERCKIIEKNHKIIHELWGGYSRHNQLYKQKFDLKNNFLDEVLIVENHAFMMYQPLLSS